MSQLPQITDVASDLQQQGLAVDIVIDRATASRFGITPATIDNVLYDAFGQRIVSTIYTQSNQYRVILEVDPTLQQSLTGLTSLYLPSSSSSTNGQVPLTAIAHIDQRAAPLLITHFGQFPATTISFNTAPGYSLDAAITAIQQAEAKAGLPLSFITAFQGTAAAFQSSLSNEVFLIIAAVVAMYIVLGVLYESFIHPITILSTLPSAGVGALLSLMLLRYDLDVIAIIGIILLIGIVKKNAIMMIDFALEAERVEGLPPRDAIYQACLLRFRPIMMTTMAAILGAHAADARHRNRLRTAPAARHRHYRRPDRQPDAHAVHHAGHLSLLRPPGGAPDRRPAGERRSFPKRRPNEHFRAIHQPAGGDDAAHARHRARRHSRVLEIAGRAAAAGRLSDHFGQRAASRRQSGNGGDQRRRAARAPSRPDRRRHRNDLATAASGRPASRCNSISTATSTARRATCRPPSTPPAPTCRRA